MLNVKYKIVVSVLLRVHVYLVSQIIICKDSRANRFVVIKPMEMQQSHKVVFVCLVLKDAKSALAQLDAQSVYQIFTGNHLPKLVLLIVDKDFFKTTIMA